MTSKIPPKVHGRFATYWRSNLLLILCLLVVWLLVTFVPAYFARALTGLFVFDWPFPFWMAAFGAQFCFLLIIGLYAWGMDRLDRRERLRRERER